MNSSRGKEKRKHCVEISCRN